METWEKTLNDMNWAAQSRIQEEQQKRLEEQKKKQETEQKRLEAEQKRIEAEKETEAASQKAAAAAERAASAEAEVQRLQAYIKVSGFMATGHVGGLSGAFIPVSEDAGIIHTAREGMLCLKKLEDITAICTVGLNMIVIPGYTGPDVISGVIADETAIDRDARKELDSGGLPGSGPVMAINQENNPVFVSRGGRIPAPLQALKN